MMNETLDYFIYKGDRIELKVISHMKNNLEPIIFLHEGLGSVSLWKDWPLKVALATKRDAIVYSRIGMGNSSPLKNKRNINYMHVEAIEILPKILKFLNINNPIIFGHSDGASIALIYAGSGFNSKALILEAPHVFVEKISVQGAKYAKKMWNNNDLKDKLKKYHKDVDGAFNGWCNAWTSKEFRNWNIEKYLDKITIPILLIQGNDDTYGTSKQLESIENNTKGIIKRYELENCGHSPHTQYPSKIINQIKNFLQSN